MLSSECTFEQFQSLSADGYTLIPVVREMLCDFDTPLSVYMKLVDGTYSYLFESVQGGERFGRYSIIGLPARRTYAFDGYELTVKECGKVIETRRVADPFAEIERLRTAHSVPHLEDIPGFTGGLVGWFGFECVQYIEPRLAAKKFNKPDELGTPDIFLMQSEEIAIFDNFTNRLYLIVYIDPCKSQAWARANHRLDELSNRLVHSGIGYPKILCPKQLNESDFVSGFSRDDFINAVKKSKELIAAGDIFQVVLSQRLSVPFHARPIDVYRALRVLNPSPYMHFLDVDDVQIAGASPEVLIRQQRCGLDDYMVTARPIAGTRPRGKTHAEDAALESELLADAKERAEHLMLIDLGRNDIGHISVPGTVEVRESFGIERYSHVMHIVSEVCGKLKPGLNYMDVLRASFPAGTVSGAPKIRALEVIQELEPVKRNIYSGALGYIGWNGDADVAIAIRTAVIKNHRLYVQTGAGIVYDSDPMKEWEETMHKGKALFAAVAEAAQGL